MPPGPDWFVATSYESAIRFLTSIGCPAVISFDHDLGGIKSGLDIAKWLIDKDLMFNGEFIPKNFEFDVHSANIIGAENIEKLLGQYLRFRQNKEED